MVDGVDESSVLLAVTLVVTTLLRSMSTLVSE